MPQTKTIENSFCLRRPRREWKSGKVISVSQQNIYDNDLFFANFLRIRSGELNFNDVIETPILLEMLPDLRGLDVLDLGCGMGQHARQYSGMGAASVLGIDISEKMLAYANANNRADNVTYCRLAMEDVGTLTTQFDLVTSSLAFDYVCDLDALFHDIRGLLKPGGQLVFSMSHPMATAWDGKYDRYTRTETGERLYANIGNYWVEGLRRVKWVVEDYQLYHRTFSTLVNSLIGAGFVIEECRESRVPDELRMQHPETFGGTIHRPDFVFFRCGKAARTGTQPEPTCAIASEAASVL